MVRRQPRARGDGPGDHLARGGAQARSDRSRAVGMRRAIQARTVGVQFTTWATSGFDLVDAEPRGTSSARARRRSSSSDALSSPRAASAKVSVAGSRRPTRAVSLTRSGRSSATQGGNDEHDDRSAGRTPRFRSRSTTGRGLNLEEPLPELLFAKVPAKQRKDHRDLVARARAATERVVTLRAGLDQARKNDQRAVVEAARRGDDLPEPTLPELEQRSSRRSGRSRARGRDRSVGRRAARVRLGRARARVRVGPPDRGRGDRACPPTRRGARRGHDRTRPCEF